MRPCAVSTITLTLALLCRYDNCNCQAGDPIIDRFTAMRDALNSTGRPVLFSMCLWGTGDAWRWGGQVHFTPIAHSQPVASVHVHEHCMVMICCSAVGLAVLLSR